MTESKQRTGSVLLIAADEPCGRSVRSALEAATLTVECVKSIAELRARAGLGERGAPRLVFLDLELPDATVEGLVAAARDGFPLATTIALTIDPCGERAARLLSQGVPSLTKPVSPLALTALALRLLLSASPALPAMPRALRSAAAHGTASGSARSTHLDAMFASYSSSRVLSKQQRMILRLYLDGMNDKEIAQACGCSEATVYEHWRRMARKAGGAHKGDVVSDFHRFLDSHTDS